MPTLYVAKSVSAGSNHNCAVLTDGTIRCWGSNLAGELGIADYYSSCLCSWSPLQIAGITNAVAVAAGSEYSCAVLGDGTVRCWGEADEYYGLLGSGTITNAVNLSAAPAEIHGHTCVLLSDGGNPSRSPTFRQPLPSPQATSTRARCCGAGLSSAGG
jgi:alpha-tubulin suppressor-like RCC1 family protein